MMELYAEVAGLPRRRFVTVPVLTPGLSSHWVGLVTPVPVPLARELVESLVNEVVVTDHRADDVFDVHPIGLRDAISRALASAQSGAVPTSFVDADLAPFAPVPTDPDWSGGTTLTDVRTTTTPASPAAVYATLERIGGERGWYSGELLWQARGILDQLLGGPGLRRGRRDPDTLVVGDALDFWRVEQAEPDHLFVSTPRCASPVRPGSTWELAPEEPSPGSSKPPSTAPAACSAAPTGLASRPSTASCSLGSSPRSSPTLNRGTRPSPADGNPP